MASLSFSNTDILNNVINSTQKSPEQGLQSIHILILIAAIIIQNQFLKIVQQEISLNVNNKLARAECGVDTEVKMDMHFLKREMKKLTEFEC